MYKKTSSLGESEQEGREDGGAEGQNPAAKTRQTTDRPEPPNPSHSLCNTLVHATSRNDENDGEDDEDSRTLGASSDLLEDGDRGEERQETEAT